ncbi:MAG: 2Fe-2S iron-sulfur cluster-binding protein [Anaerolineae bacterium]
MSTAKWDVTFQVYRQKGDAKPHFDSFTIPVDPDEYILDGIERVWAFHDRSLCFRHACHHSTCGACGMRVNGVEKLTCITPVHTMTKNGGVVKVEPLRNFPVVSDLVVDLGLLYERTELMGQQAVISLADEPAGPVAGHQPENKESLRLSDCIECGLCVSACPIVATTPNYLAPAALAAAQQNGLNRRPDLLKWVDGENGVWRCHSAFECSAVCPSNVDPAGRIMDLRRQVIGARLKRLFKPQKSNGQGEK